MREILFRGKRLDNGKWVQSGNIIQFLDNEVRATYIPQFAEKCTTSEDENGNLLSFELGVFYKVGPATVGQFTGLVDKNGAQIFKGDILWDGQLEVIGVVSWDEGTLAWMVAYDDECEYLSEFVGSGSMVATDASILGNIHDNPELLSGTPEISLAKTMDDLDRESKLGPWDTN